jgi:nucleoside-diphosphate-sugar epimerase
VAGTRAALAFARAGGARRFVHISTPSLYFRFRDQPGVREDAPLPSPVNAYTATKHLAEELVRAETGLDTLILRPRGLYGKGDMALLPRLLRAAQSGPLPLIRDGTAETDLTHVEDVVDAAIAALDAPESLATRVFNISGGEPCPYAGSRKRRRPALEFPSAGGRCLRRLWSARRGSWNWAQICIRTNRSRA